MKNIIISVVVFVSIFSLYLPYRIAGAVILGCGGSNTNLSEPCAEQYCRLKFPYSVLDSLSSDGQATCKCRDDYQWNDSKTVCEKIKEEVVIGQPSFLIPPTTEARCNDLNESFVVIMPAKIRIGQSYNGYIKARKTIGCGSNFPIPERQDDKNCQQHYGLNSGWSGKSNSEDGPICDCVEGYRFDDIKNTCIAEPITPEELPEKPPTLTDDQLCEEKYESAKSVVAPDGTKSCECRHGYVWNSDKTTCIYTSIASTAKPISRIENPVAPESVTIVSSPTVIVPAPITSTKVTSTTTEATTTSSSVSSTTQKEAPVRQGFWARVWKWFSF